MILGAGQKSRIGKLGGGAAIGALMFNATAGFAAVAISDGGTVVQGAAVATANSNIGVAGATASDFAIAIVGDADCNTLSSGTTTALGVYGTGVNNTGGLYGFGAQTTATDFVPNSNVGLGQTSGIRNFNSNNAFTGNVQIGANNVARTQAFGLNSLAIGCGVVSQGLGAVGIGLGAISNGSGSVAFGIDARATGQGSIATGVGSRATQVDTIAFGALSQANGASAIAIGAQSNAAAANTIALGKNASASAAAAIATGQTVTQSVYLQSTQC